MTAIKAHPFALLRLHFPLLENLHSFGCSWLMGSEQEKNSDEQEVDETASAGVIWEGGGAAVSVTHEIKLVSTSCHTNSVRVYNIDRIT